MEQKTQNLRKRPAGRRIDSQYWESSKSFSWKVLFL